LKKEVFFVRCLKETSFRIKCPIKFHNLIAERSSPLYIFKDIFQSLKILHFLIISRKNYPNVIKLLMQKILNWVSYYMKTLHLQMNYSQIHPLMNMNMNLFHKRRRYTIVPLLKFYNLLYSCIIHFLVEKDKKRIWKIRK